MKGNLLKKKGNTVYNFQTYAEISTESYAIFFLVLQIYSKPIVLNKDSHMKFPHS